MWRSILLLVGVMLATGCAPTRYTYYGANDYRDYDPVAADSGYVDAGYAADRYRSDVTLGIGYYDYPDWFDYPAYYSLFWSFNRLYVDPYWHPHFYYGVTWYPRNYFSLSYRYYPYGGSTWRPFYHYLSYSPYRLSWVDYYYDWYPWYAHHPGGYWSGHNYYVPRYGSARHEAERLSRFSSYRGSPSPYFQDNGRSPRRWDDRAQQREQVIDRREAVRGADYGSGSRSRIDPRVSGFRNGEPSQSSSGGRVDPAVSGFRTPREGSVSPSDRSRASESREALRDYQGRNPPNREEGIPYPYRSGSEGRGREATSGSRERAPVAPTAPRYTSPRAEPISPRYSAPRESVDYGDRGRSESRPVPQYRAPSREASVDSGSRGAWSAPPPREPPRYERQEQPRYERQEQPRFERQEQPRFDPPVEREAPRREESRDEGARGEASRLRESKEER